MKSDIDSLMQEREIDVLLVTGPGTHNPAMVYLTGGGHLTGGDLIKKRGEAAVLFHFPMERDEAALTGLQTKSLADYKLHELYKQFNGDMLKVTVRRYEMMLSDLGVISGRVALYGQADAGTTLAIFSALQQAIPQLTFVNEVANSLLLQAMMTKDAEEVARIRNVGHKTTVVVGQTLEFLCSHRTMNGVLVKSDGSPLTIGDVKHRINLWLAELGLENPEDTIFAIGYDSGVPHSSGKPSDPLRLGETIIFDIFPCEAGGGYYYDMTRTWCLGYAPEEALALYEDVHTVYHSLIAELRIDTPGKDYQERTCELFELRGHPTIRSDPQTQIGYVHGLGHGVGLHIHERPSLGRFASDSDRLYPGTVITVEPGLYYPERGLGVRIEDTIWVRPDGKFEVLAEYSHNLVIPMKR